MSSVNPKTRLLLAILALVCSESGHSQNQPTVDPEVSAASAIDAGRYLVIVGGENQGTLSGQPATTSSGDE